jgi:Flp pilus assembly protein TadD
VPVFAGRALPAGGALLAFGAAAACLLPGSRSGWAGLAVLAAHALLPLVGLPILLLYLVGVWRTVVGATGVTALALGGAAWIPGAPAVLGWLHVGTSVLTLALATAALAVRLGAAGRRRLIAAGAFALALLPAALWAASEYRYARWSPPVYDAEACYRFLTATTVEQSDAPSFPSAIRVRGEEAECASACHVQQHAKWESGGHAVAGNKPAYRAAFADFIRRRGVAAGRWCQGCHNPDSQRGPTGAGSAGVGCAACHSVKDVLALYGSAALQVGQGLPESAARAETLLRPGAHRQAFLRPEMHRSSVFCGGCHRKNWSLPQNEFDWMAGPDEYGEWQASRFSGESLLAPGERGPARGCVSCHDPHGTGEERARPSGMELDLFLTAAGGEPQPAPSLDALRPGTPAELDVVVRNALLGHDFPYGMPDLYDTWLEVEAVDVAGRVVQRSGAPGSGTADWTLRARDRAGRPIVHGDLDRMVSVSEWRRIPAGESDLARYRFRVPRGGLGDIRVRLLRRRRAELSRWSGEAARPLPYVLAETRLTSGSAVQGLQLARTWRDYGSALAAGRSYAAAVRALNRALELSPEGHATLLALAQVFLAEGDLLAARERFRQAGPRRPELAAAWEAVVVRPAQPEEAAKLLEPLVKRYPRDRRLRFELGRAYMAELRHEDAARQFQALLDVDPLDAAGHYNLMLCWQRLNRQADARREEALYQLLSTPESASAGPARPLRVYSLDPVR